MSAGWDVKEDQEDISNFRLSDLQTGMSVGTSGIVSATMKHKMGLLYADIPSAQTADDVITYDGNSYSTSLAEKWNRITAKCTTVTWNASMNFTSSTHKPYKVTSDSKLYFISKPSVSTVAISTTAGTQLYAWSASGSNTTITTANQYKEFTVATPDYSNAFNKKVWEFSWGGTGQGRQWVAPATGTYTMECWGASGGGSRKNGTFQANEASLGGYVYGKLDLTKDATFYIYVGQKGTDAVVGKNSAGGWNGGGMGTWDNVDDESAGGGGGATDIRLSPASSSNYSKWYTFDSMKSRIMVAGGGGGRNYTFESAGFGHGGGLEGGNGYGADSYRPSGGTQTSDSSLFGKGSDGAGRGGSDGQAGGGGGYYGGKGGNDSDGGSKSGSGGGGCSYVSGLTGCIAIEESSTSSSIQRKSNSEHYSGYVFTDPKTISGNTNETANQPVPGDTTGLLQKGQSGNGFARITYTP